jgi:hypothetical protein
MSDQIEIICNLSGCSVEDAKRVFEETKDIVESVDRLLVKPKNFYEKYIPVKKEPVLTPDQIEVKKVRELMKIFDDKRSTSTNQLDCVTQTEKPILHEETVLQNNCFQQCQIPSLVEEVEKPETVYQ